MTVSVPRNRLLPIDLPFIKSTDNQAVCELAVLTAVRSGDSGWFGFVSTPRRQAPRPGVAEHCWSMSTVPPR